MNNEDNVYEFLGGVQVLTKEGVETKFEELEETLPQKINDALGTSLDEKIDEAVSDAIIDAGGVTPADLEEVKAELAATDTALQAADTLLDQRITVLENAGPSGGTGDVTTEMLNEVKTELENADTALSERITALEVGGGSGGSTTDEIITMNISVDIDGVFDASTWVLLDSINFDTLYQSYITKTNKPVVINIGMATDTGATQYSYRDVITSAEDTQIRITGDAMSTAIVPNIRFTIDLVLIKDEITGSCIIDTEQSKMFMTEAGGGSGEAVSEKIFEFTGEYLLDPAADEPTFTVNIDTIDSDKFKEAVDDNYKFQLYLRAPQTQMPIVITTYMYAIQGTNYVFMFNLDNLGMVSEELYGRVQISVMQNEDTGNYELSTYGIDKGDDDTISLVTLDKRVTALEENGSGGGSTADDLDSYTYIIDSQEKFDAFCLASNASEADSNDYSHVLIKNGNYTIIEGHGIRLDNTAVPILSITGESQDGVVIDLQATYAFYCLEKENQITQSISTLSITAFGSGYYIFYKVDHVTNVTSYAKAASQGSPAVYSYVFYYCDDIQNCTTYHNDLALNESSTCTNCTFGENDLAYSDHAIGIGCKSIYNNCTFSYNERTAQYNTANALFSGNTFIDCVLNIPVSLSISNAIIKHCTITTHSLYLRTDKSFDNNAIANVDTTEIVDSTITITELKYTTFYSNSNIRAFNNSTFRNCNITVQQLTYNMDETKFGENIYFIYDSLITNCNITISNFNYSVPNPSAYYLRIVESSTVTSSNVFILSVTATTSKYVTLYVFDCCDNIQDSHGYIDSACPAAGVIFSHCNNLINCSNYIDDTHYGTGTAIVFTYCKNLTNCTAYLTRLTKVSTSDTLDSNYSIGYDHCYNLRGCCVTLDAKYIAADTTQASYVQCIGYNSCNTLANCTFKHISLQPYANTGIIAYAKCNDLVSCTFIPSKCESNKNILDVQIDTTQSTRINYKVYYSCFYMTNCYGNTELYGDSIASIAPGISNMYTTVFYLSALDSTITAQTNSIQISFSAFYTCYFLSNCITIYKGGVSYVTILTQSNTTFPTDSYVMKNLYHFYLCKQLTNCVAIASDGSIAKTTGIQNCILCGVDTATCSASQTYAADYAVADTPAGGFNNILS